MSFQSTPILLRKQEQFSNESRYRELKLITQLHKRADNEISTVENSSFFFFSKLN